MAEPAELSVATPYTLNWTTSGFERKAHKERDAISDDLKIGRAEGA